MSKIDKINQEIAEVEAAIRRNEKAKEIIPAMFNQQDGKNPAYKDKSSAEVDQQFGNMQIEGVDVDIGYTRGGKPTQQDSFAVSTGNEPINTQQMKDKFDHINKTIGESNLTGGTTLSTVAMYRKGDEIKITAANAGDSPIKLILTNEQGEKELVELAQEMPAEMPKGLNEALAENQAKQIEFTNNGDEFTFLPQMNRLINKTMPKAQSEIQEILKDANIQMHSNLIGTQGIEAFNTVGDSLNNNYCGANVAEATLKVQDGKFEYNGKPYKDAQIFIASDGVQAKGQKKEDFDDRLKEFSKKDKNLAYQFADRLKTEDKLVDNLAAVRFKISTNMKEEVTISATVADGNGKYGQYKAMNAVREIQESFGLDMQAGIQLSKDNTKLELVGNGKLEKKNIDQGKKFENGKENPDVKVEPKGDDPSKEKESNELNIKNIISKLQENRDELDTKHRLLVDKKNQLEQKQERTRQNLRSRPEAKLVRWLAKKAEDIGKAAKKAEDIGKAAKKAASDPKSLLPKNPLKKGKKFDETPKKRGSRYGF